MAIDTFVKREKAGLIFSLYFDPESEHYLGFELFDTIDFYNETEEAEMLCKKLDKLGERLYKEMRKFDKKNRHFTLPKK